MITSLVLDDFAVKNLGPVIIFDVSEVTFIFHHGVRPASVKNRRKDHKAPLSVSFRGWGRIQKPSATSIERTASA